MIIKTHKELATKIHGKTILHLNSLGKDSVLCLEWLTNFAKPKKIYSLNYKFLAPHPDDEKYLNYLKKRYPSVEFIQETNPFDINRTLIGYYQSPIETINFWNKQEYDTFDHQKLTEAIRIEVLADYSCYGLSRYESFARANKIRKKGLLNGTQIYPLGMMSKQQVIDLIKKTGVKLHPIYKINESTLDKPSYYKMRAAFLINKEYKQKVYNTFPLLALDEYRWTKLLNKS